MKFSTIVFSLLVSLAAQSEVIEVKSMAEAQKLITSQTLVVFDIDNTLLAPIQTLGSDQWFGYLVEQFQKCGTNESEAIDRAIRIWTKVQKATKVRPIEKGTPGFARRLVQNRVAILGLTARPLDLAEATSKQLQSVGYPRFAMPELNQRPTMPQGTIFNDGVIFVGPKLNKGTVLKNFLQKHNLQYDRIVFVDDKAKHVPQIANIQWNEFVKTRRLIRDADTARLPNVNFSCSK